MADGFKINLPVFIPDNETVELNLPHESGGTLVLRIDAHVEPPATADIKVNGLRMTVRAETTALDILGAARRHDAIDGCEADWRLENCENERRYGPGARLAVHDGAEFLAVPVGELRRLEKVRRIGGVSERDGMDFTWEKSDTYEGLLSPSSHERGKYWLVHCDAESPKGLLIGLCPGSCGRLLCLNMDAGAGPSWSFEVEDDGSLTVDPSVRDLKCGAHFWFRKGRVEFCSDHSCS